MKKNLLYREAANAICARVEKLSHENAPRWGEMNATEMLLHCNICNRQILEEERGDEKTAVGQYLLRILALYIAPHFKKGVKSEPRNITKGLIDSASFNEQKDEFVRLIKQFPLQEKEFTLTHPAFGNISTNEWGIAAYKHMDHHLRQFGI